MSPWLFSIVVMVREMAIVERSRGGEGQELVGQFKIFGFVEVEEDEIKKNSESM